VSADLIYETRRLVYLRNSRDWAEAPCRAVSSAVQRLGWGKLSSGLEQSRARAGPRERESSGE